MNLNVFEFDKVLFNEAMAADGYFTVISSNVAEGEEATTATAEKEPIPKILHIALEQRAGLWKTCDTIPR